MTTASNLSTSLPASLTSTALVVSSRRHGYPDGQILGRRISTIVDYTTKSPITLAQRIVHLLTKFKWVSRSQVSSDLCRTFGDLKYTFSITKNINDTDVTNTQCAVAKITQALNQLKGWGLSKKTAEHIKKIEASIANFKIESKSEVIEPVKPVSPKSDIKIEVVIDSPKKPATAPVAVTAVVAAPIVNKTARVNRCVNLSKINDSVKSQVANKAIVVKAKAISTASAVSAKLSPVVNGVISTVGKWEFLNYLCLKYILRI